MPPVSSQTEASLLAEPRSSRQKVLFGLESMRISIACLTKFFLLQVYAMSHELRPSTMAVVAKFEAKQAAKDDSAAGAATADAPPAAANQVPIPDNVIEAGLQFRQRQVEAGGHRGPRIAGDASAGPQHPPRGATHARMEALVHRGYAERGRPLADDAYARPASAGVASLAQAARKRGRAGIDEDFVRQSKEAVREPLKNALFSERTEEALLRETGVRPFMPGEEAERSDPDDQEDEELSSEDQDAADAPKWEEDTFGRLVKLVAEDKLDPSVLTDYLQHRSMKSSVPARARVDADLDRMRDLSDLLGEEKRVLTLEHNFAKAIASPPAAPAFLVFREAVERLRASSDYVTIESTIAQLLEGRRFVFGEQPLADVGLELVRASLRSVACAYRAALLGQDMSMSQQAIRNVSDQFERSARPTGFKQQLLLQAVARVSEREQRVLQTVGGRALDVEKSMVSVGVTSPQRTAFRPLPLGSPGRASPSRLMQRKRVKPPPIPLDRRVCFNCLGRGHSDADCPAPRLTDQAQRDRNRKAALIMSGAKHIS